MKQIRILKIKEKYNIKSILSKILMFFLILVLIWVSGGIYIKDFVYGYKYYDSKSMQIIGVTKEEDFLFKTVKAYLAELEENGYHIASYNINLNLFYKQAIIDKTKTNEDYFKKQIISNLDIDILSTKLIIKDDSNIYYFKNENDCKDFIKELNKYETQKYVIENTIENYLIITDRDVLDKKINNVKKKMIEEIKAKDKVTSRGNINRNENKNKNIVSYKYISSSYGNRHGKMHTGIDLAANYGTLVYSWKAGTVIFAGYKGNYGNFIEIEHNDGTVSRYAHLSKILVSKGQYISKGQNIGKVGSTGNSTGNHLHFEVKVNGNFVNPINYI